MRFSKYANLQRVRVVHYIPNTSEESPNHFSDVIMNITFSLNLVCTELQNPLSVRAQRVVSTYSACTLL